MHTFDVLIRPIYTEKATNAGELGRYTFEVHPKANKLQVKQAVEAAYQVVVVDVNIMNMPGKSRRLMTRKLRHNYASPGWRKAIVTLQKGQSITLFEGV